MREAEPADDDEHEEWHARAVVGASLIAGGLNNLELLRKALTRNG